MSEEVILYDIPSKDPRRCWSLNPWKTRLVLNLKGIPYKTEWLEYPDIAPTLKQLNIPPSEPPATAYTSPTIRISDKYVTDSRKIADVLEKKNPSPSLHLDSPILKKVEELAPQCVMSLGPVFIPRIPRFMLNPRSAEYFERTREARFGMSLSQLEKEKGGESAWKAAEPKWKELGTLLKAEGGPFFMGKTVSYADLIVVGALHCFAFGDGDMFQRVKDIEPAFLTLYDASKAWLERDDH
ncbi:MAG: hypothetical protein ALECFALPRED_001977 [Alectoria fallacina]|uniref:GST N-terminal domain-containing protein n=1 Tax=Alectoria fallacina TaxID=1903189 RepID=A0A8H3FC45_9LECA|nr:MAG: hypothetical protein ALECFALPRED_001977 [Alectoria fallacina]